MLQSNKSRLLLFILFGSNFIFGFLENIKGVSYPLIKNEFSVSYDTLGKMLSMLTVSYTFCIVASGFLLSRFSVKKIFVLSFIFIILGLLSINVMSSFWTVASSLLFLFAGFGIIEIATNGVATQLFTKKAALMMNLLHFMYGVGAIAGPKAAGILADPAGIGMLWRKIYFFSIPLALIILVPMIFTKFPDYEPENKNGNNEGETRKEVNSFFLALKTPAVWVIGITLGIMISLEMASSNWGSLYFQDLYGMDPTTRGANFVSVFYILFTSSRLLSGFIIEKIGYFRSLIGATLISIVIFSIGFSLGASGIYVLPLLGFFYAIFFPTMIAVTMGYFGNNAVMVGAVIGIGGLGNAAMQLLMGYITQWIGTGWGYRSCLPIAAILLIILLKISRRYTSAAALKEVSAG